MVDLELREERNALRSVVTSAAKNEVITREEAGFVLTLVERFRTDITKKEKQALVLQGEISQLRANEQIIVQLVEGLVAAAERDIARRETAQKLRDAREVESERRANVLQSLKEEEAANKSEEVPADQNKLDQ